MADSPLSGLRGRLTRAACLALACACSAPAAAGCGDALDARARRIVEAKTHTLAFAPLPAPWQAGRHFALEIEVCAHEGASPPLALRVDADMPAHRHGMNYAVTVRRLADGRYRAEGLLFHMPGRWRVRFALSADGRLVQLAHEVEVP